MYRLYTVVYKPARVEKKSKRLWTMRELPLMKGLYRQTHTYIHIQPHTHTLFRGHTKIYPPPLTHTHSSLATNRQTSTFPLLYKLLQCPSSLSRPTLPRPPSLPRLLFQTWLLAKETEEGMHSHATTKEMSKTRTNTLTPHKHTHTHLHSRYYSLDSELNSTQLKTQDCQHLSL